MKIDFLDRSGEYKLRPYRASLTVKDIDVSVVNAWRRAAMLETPNYAMHCDIAGIITQDPFIIKNFIADRIGLIPILQSVPVATTWNLFVRNDSFNAITVKSEALKSSNGEKWFDGQFTICTLNPGYSLEIRNVRLERGVGHGKFALALQCVCLYDDDVKLPETPQSIGNLFEECRGFKLEWLCNGGVEANRLVKMVCDNLRERVKSVMSCAELVEDLETEKVLTVSDTHTIGYMFERFICRMNPDLGSCCSRFDMDGMRFELRFNMGSCAEKPEKLIKAAGEAILKDIDKIAK